MMYSDSNVGPVLEGLGLRVRNTIPGTKPVRIDRCSITDFVLQHHSDNAMTSLAESSTYSLRIIWSTDRVANTIPPSSGCSWKITGYFKPVLHILVCSRNLANGSIVFNIQLK